MKEFIEKLIGRLEEKFKYNSEQAEIWRNGSDKDAYFREKKDLYMDRANTYGEVMRIVNQLAEEYNNEPVKGDLISRSVLLEEIKSLRVTVTGLRAGKGILAEYVNQYKNTLLRVIEEQPTAYNDGWIPCSKLPEKDGIYLCKVFHADDYVVWIMRFNNGEFLRPDDVENLDYELIEWKYI